MADNKLELRIIAPDKASNRDPYKLQKDCDMVIIRCSTGDMGFLPGRMPCSMVLDPGVMRMFDEGTEERMAIHGGIGHIQENVITILADGAQWPNEIDVKLVNAEMTKTQEQLDKSEDTKERDSLRRELRRCRVQLEVAGKQII